MKCMYSKNYLAVFIIRKCDLVEPLIYSDCKVKSTIIRYLCHPTYSCLPSLK